MFRICRFLCWFLKNVLMISLGRAVWIFNVVLTLQPVAPWKCLVRCPCGIAAVTSKLLQMWSNDFSRLFWDPSWGVENPLWLHEFKVFKPWDLRLYRLQNCKCSWGSIFGYLGNTLLDFSLYIATPEHALCSDRGTFGLG